MSTKKTVPNSTKAKTLAALQALLDGLQQQHPGGSFTLQSTTYSTASLVALLTGVIAAIQALNALQLQTKAAVTTARDALAQAGPTIAALRRTLVAMYGNAPQTLALYGLAPPKERAPLTVEQKALAAARVRSTRKARGTTSKKQKAAIKGNVTGVQITPVTASGTPAAPGEPTAGE